MNQRDLRFFNACRRAETDGLLIENETIDEFGVFDCTTAKEKGDDISREKPAVDLTLVSSQYGYREDRRCGPRLGRSLSARLERPWEQEEKYVGKQPTRSRLECQAFFLLACTFEFNAVEALRSSESLSLSSTGTLILFRISVALSAAFSNDSAMAVGWRPKRDQCSESQSFRSLGVVDVH